VPNRKLRCATCRTIRTEGHSFLDPYRRYTLRFGQVDFAYYGAGHALAGMPDFVRGPMDANGQRAVEKVTYDARGNLRTTVSPLGFLTFVERDALGRDSVVYTPIADDNTARSEALLKQYGAHQTIAYDTLGRVRETVSYGPAIVHQPAQSGFGPGTTGVDSLRVITTYDAEGSPLSVTRIARSNPAGLADQVTTYSYDAAGRRTDEWNGQIHTTTTYDLAGNPVSVLSPRNGNVTSTYDAAGRVTRRAVPMAVYPETNGTCTAVDSIPCSTAKFPFYPNAGTSLRIPEEWTYYRYDTQGNLLYAENADAIVRRSYYPNGQVNTDSTWIRDFTDNGGFTKVYGIQYGYDAGRVTRLVHPTNLSGTTYDRDKFAYDPVTGALSAAEDRSGNAFGFVNDKAGRPRLVQMPGGVVDSLFYDLQGRLTHRVERSPAHTAPLQEETFAYDARDKMLRVTVPPTEQRQANTTFSQWYSGLGNLVMTDWANASDPQWQRERFNPDPLGNTVSRHVYEAAGENPGNDEPDYQYTYDPGHGRVTRVQLVDVMSQNAWDDTRKTYDESGNQESTYQFVTQDGAVQRIEQGRSYYGLDERLRVFQQYVDKPSGPQGVSTGLWEEYRYDPLGRRMGVRTLRPVPLCNQPAECFTTTTYFVWAGDQLLWEIKDAADPAPAQADGIVSYFHAGGIDRPLTIWKAGTTVVTHQSWRGQFARGTYGNGPRAGQLSDCDPQIGYPQQDCVPVQWPGFNTSAWHEGAAKPRTVGDDTYWMRSLAVGMRDATGQMYMRNRYYDPQTGQFTQPDPIGLAGGLNSYGFAAGDPVSYSDPYGLCPPIASCILNGLRNARTVAWLEAGQTRRVMGTDVRAVRRTDFGVGTNQTGHTVLEFRGAFTIDNPELPRVATHLHLEMGAIDLDSGEYDIIGSRGYGVVTAHVQGNFKAGSGSVTYCAVGVLLCGTTEFPAKRAPQRRQSPDSDPPRIMCSKGGQGCSTRG
jgi:RHS repeat-associated protein